MSTLNSGPYQYSRFSAIDDLYERERQYYTQQLAEKKKAKPDFLDVDGDGDKEESFKKGVKDKEKGEGKKDAKKEGKKELPAFLQKKKDMKEGKCSPGCDCEDCKKDKKVMKEQTIEEKVIEYFLENGFANNPVSAEVLLHNASEDWLNTIANMIQEGKA